MTKTSFCLDDHVCFSIYAANNLINRLYNPLLKELGLTYPQYLVLVVLWENDKQLVTEIGKKLYLETNTLTPLLKRMEQNNLIERNRSREDERKVSVSLTNHGKKLKSKAACIPEAIMKASNNDTRFLDRLNKDIKKLQERLSQ